MIFSGPDTYPGKVAGALQVDAFHLIKAFCKPRIKVGTEWVIKGQTCDQVRNHLFMMRKALMGSLGDKTSLEDIYLDIFL